VPELLSPTYRNRVRTLSPRNRNSGVQHLPGSHNALNQDPVHKSVHMLNMKEPRSNSSRALTCTYLGSGGGI
jgi:hypothetical protein